MNTEQILLLLGLFFIGTSLPGLITKPNTPAVIQFVFGAVLFALALLMGVRIIV